MIECLIMAKAEFELGVYVNDFAPYPVRRKAREMIQLLPDESNSFYLVISSHLERNRIPEKLAVAGGDGSIGRIMQMLYDQKAIIPVAVLPGGSQNVLYHTLLDLGLTADAGTFLKKPLDDYPENQRLKPGMINKRVFVNHVGLGHFEQHLGRFNARLRFLPSLPRLFLSASLSLAAASLHPGKDFLNLYTITPRVGSVLAFPGQRLLSNELTHAWMRRGWIRQLRGFRFHDATLGNYAWFDGDTRFYPQREVLIARAPYGIPVVALT